MYEIAYTNRMKRDAKLMKKRGRNLEKLVEVLNLLASGILCRKNTKTTG